VVGRSTGPHLHFSNRGGPGLPSQLALFEAKLAVGGVPLECYEPTTGTALISTNVPQF
jgi:murein DD-endopeptidase MepM/ murein hydrolase activator NlpD